MTRMGAVVSRVVVGAVAVMLGAQSSTHAQGGGTAVRQGDLEDGVWVLTRFGPAGSLATPAAGSRIDLSFEQGRASGSSGCNTYSGTYVLEGNALRMGGLASTRMACAPALMKQEDEYQQILRAATTATIAGDVLKLSGPAGTLEFRAEQQKLAGTWNVMGYNNGKGGVVSIKTGSTLTVVVDDSGRISGSSGCNNYTGTYKVSGKTITIGPLASTRKMCEDAEVMAQEQLFLKALPAGTAIELRGDDLRLRNDKGATQVHLRRQAAAGG